jgi:LacI family repressor for deo operon, udp, cdd, tsx, nupC, and nupG
MVPPAGLDIDVLVRELQARGVVVVLLARYLDTRLDLDLDYVSVDNQRIGYEATRHLLELGHTGIVHLPGTRTTTVRDRAVGYVRAMREVSLEPRMLAPPTEPGAPPGELAPYLVDPDPALLWAQVGRRDVTAAFCFNDGIATWVQKEVRNLNLSIPRDLSIIAVDNMPYADFFDAPLTTFALPGEEVAGEAASLVLRRLNGEPLAAQHVLIPARLMVRRSTAPPRRATGQLAASTTRSK